MIRAAAVSRISITITFFARIGARPATLLRCRDRRYGVDRPQEKSIVGKTPCATNRFIRKADEGGKKRPR